MGKRVIMKSGFMSPKVYQYRLETGCHSTHIQAQAHAQSHQAGRVEFTKKCSEEKSCGVLKRKISSSRIFKICKNLMRAF